MSFHCLSWAELIRWSFRSLILIEIFGVFLSRSLLHISPSFSLLLHPLLSQFSVVLSHFSAFSCGAPRPLSLALAAHFFPLSFAFFSQNPLIASWKLSWCVYSLFFFSASSSNYQKCFHLSLSLSAAFICSLSPSQPYLVLLSRFPFLFLNLYAFVTGYL